MRWIRAVSLPVAVLVLGLIGMVVSAPAAGAAVPAGFSDELVTNIAAPTALAFTPDGRVLVTTQPGTLRVVENDVLLATPAVNLAGRICTNSERGLLGVAVDPAFATNGFVFLYYSFNRAGDCGSGTVNRVARFVMTGNTLGGEVVLIDNIPSPAGNHNGGDLNFGKDGMLYVSVGDGGCDYPGGTPSGCGGSNDASRDRHSLVGKILRIDRNGGVPADNPFTGAGTASCRAGNVASGVICRETFAWGLRNPFRIAFDPNAATTRFHINDVGQNTWEEIDLGAAGADYGWNLREGHCANGSTTDCGTPPAGMTNPIFDYGRADGCTSITGGAFVPNGTWPAEYQGKYLFADYVCGRIFRLDPIGSGGFNRVDFATGLGGGSAVDLRFGPWNGGQALYYTSYAGGGQVRRIVSTANQPSPPVNATATATGSGSARVTWGAPVSGSTPTSFTVTPSAGSGGVPMTVGAATRTASFTGLSGSAVTFAVTATTAAGTSGPATSNAVNAAASTPVRDLVSDRQYQLTGSDGLTWIDMDPVNLAGSYTPPASGQLVLDANIDLWTASAGVNQDVAVVVAGGAYGSGTVVGWKESGGFTGTFSPNAAAVNTAVDVEAGTLYTVKLAWKANIPAGGKTIYAGAGPIGGGFSPARLTARFTPAATPVGLTRRSDQFFLTGGDGTTWRSMTATTAGTTVAPVTQSFTASATGIAAITGNADLWTWNAQYNQDLALKVSGGVYGAGTIVAWKESGGFAGTFSPNAALVEARVAVENGAAYTAELVWKANRPMPAGVAISAGAGSPGAPSPTTITVTQHPTATTASRTSAVQYRLDGSDAATWRDLDTPAHNQAPFDLTYIAPADGYLHLVGNADLWTYAAGYNQDIGIQVKPPVGDPGTAPGGIVAWKESGGFAGTFSPNAAAVEGFHPVKAGQTYTFTLVWKMNKLAGTNISISAGAGHPGDFSPTRLDLTFQPA